MPLNIPNVGNGGEALQRGVESGTNLWQQLMGQGVQQAKAQQEWQQHLRNAAIREAQEERLKGLNPLQLDALKAKIDLMNAQKEKAQREPASTQKETPEQKDQRALKLWEEKEKRKKENKSNQDFTEITPTVRTGAQQAIIAVDTVLPLLEDLLQEDIPEAYTKIFSPNQNALITAISSLGEDELMSVFKLPKVEASLEKIEQMVTRQKGESAEAFKKRLGDLTKRVEHRRAANVSILKSGKIPLEREKHQKESPEEESRKNTAAGIDARKGGTKTYNRQTGKME